MVAVVVVRSLAGWRMARRQLRNRASWRCLFRFRRRVRWRMMRQRISVCARQGSSRRIRGTAGQAHPAVPRGAQFSSPASSSAGRRRRHRVTEYGMVGQPAIDQRNVGCEFPARRGQFVRQLVHRLLHAFGSAHVNIAVHQRVELAVHLKGDAEGGIKIGLQGASGTEMVSSLARMHPCARGVGAWRSTSTISSSRILMNYEIYGGLSGPTILGRHRAVAATSPEPAVRWSSTRRRWTAPDGKAAGRRNGRVGCCASSP